MARISKAHKVIVDTHFLAWQNNSWSEENIEIAKNGIVSFNSWLHNGNSSKKLWQNIVDKYVSITGQILMNSGHMSNNAKADIQRNFRNWLVWSDASVDKIKNDCEAYKVVAVSSNTNSFGLRQHIMVSKEGRAYKVCLNSLNSHDKAAIVYVPRIIASNGNLKDPQFIGGELLEGVESPDAETLGEIWKS